jgi:hypothetical protein
MTYGQLVKVMEAFENKTLKRVVSADDRNVYVCRDEEFQLAKAEKREPISIGFPRQFVLGVEDESGKNKI